MDTLRGNRKVLPNYLLDDYVPAPDSQSVNDRRSSSSLAHAPVNLNLNESSRQPLNQPVGASTSVADSVDAPATPIGSLPRRKKKLRQACVYCRRSHLVCEEKRPCHRCVKRGIADRCVDPPQEGQLDHEDSWPATLEPSTNPISLQEARFPLSVAAASTFQLAPSISNDDITERAASDGSRNRKRKIKSEDARGSSTESHQQHKLQAAAHLEHNQPPISLEYASSAPPSSSYVSRTDYTPSRPNIHTNVQASVPSSAMSAPGAPPHTSIPQSIPMQAGSSMPARAAPSQLLQGQPIFQPPTSAELDSLFSTYFFDVADAFHTRQNGAPHDEMPPHPHNTNGQATSMFPHQPRHQPPHQQAHHPSHLAHLDDIGPDMGASLPTLHHHYVDPFVPSSSDPRNLRPAHPVAPLPQHQPRPSDLGNSHPVGSGTTSANDVADHNLSNVHATSALHVPSDVAYAQSAKLRAGSNGQEAQARQRPGDVYAPYPYRKGYASLMRYMTEQNWSEQSIRSVEAALSKIRRLWFSLEDNIQPSSLIQLQAEWAGNVRYFSESVLPFTPIPMLVCRKAGEVYASNQLAQDLCGRGRHEMTGGRLSCYELMTESSASEFFRLYELAVGGSQAEDGSYIPTVGNTAPLYWNAEIVQPSNDGKHVVIPTRGIFEMKIAPCGLPSLLVCCFVPLT